MLCVCTFENISLYSCLLSHHMIILNHCISCTVSYIYIVSSSQAYIIDDTLLLSGANLSEEYFTDRQDRYMLFVNGGGGLVDFYADLIDILCNYADEYKEGEEMQEQKLKRDMTLQEKKHELLGSLSNLLDGSNDDALVKREHVDENEVIAYAIPTVQIPTSLCPASSHTPTNVAQQQREVEENEEKVFPFPLDTTVTKNLLLAALECDPKNASVRLSSAYLNPTMSLMSVLKMFGSERGDVDGVGGAAYLLTAGPKSHGFASKTDREEKTGGNKSIGDYDDDRRKEEIATVATGNGPGRGWIPKAYTEIVKEAASQLVSRGGKVLLYEKMFWSFHAKGLWLSLPSSSPFLENENVETEKINSYIYDQSAIRATIVGSGNYGARSEYWDVESNCILIMKQIPDHHPLTSTVSKSQSPSLKTTQSFGDNETFALQEKDHQSGSFLLQSLVAKEWNDLCQYTSEMNLNRSREPLSLGLMGALQILRKFL
mmetsp:Transcript_3272/g.4753  ORF Transcript_3272/g.4753 Transcript_3272/m.4753 type:complete len:487 (-) Transcript_3272:142-1602(-)